MGVSFGLDGGFSIADADVQFVDPNTAVPNAKPTVALGIDIALYWLPSETIGFGFALSPAFLGAGPEPSPGINFAIGPRFVWRPGWFHLAADAPIVLSSWSDRCRESNADHGFDCPLTRDYEPAAPGLGVGLSPLVRVHSGSGLDWLLGPTLRYQVAWYEYPDSGTFALQVFQAVVALRGFVDFGYAPPALQKAN